MSGKNPFFDEGTAGSAGAGSSWNDWEDVGKESTDYDSKNDYGFDFQSKQMEIDRRKQNMLSSTHRSMGLMYEAEQVGNETAAVSTAVGSRRIYDSTCMFGGKSSVHVVYVSV